MLVSTTGEVIERRSGREYGTTNNRMELRAAIEAVKLAPEGGDISVTTDSQYVVLAFNDGWIAKWEKNGWWSNKGQVKNQDLWRELIDLCARRTVTWKWVRGHAGHTYNELCDKMASAESSLCKSENGK